MRRAHLKKKMQICDVHFSSDKEQVPKNTHLAQQTFLVDAFLCFFMIF